eukprot:CAMPEP_0205930622 /NCGR_PEP_ID=MMETSP1325-20131115/26002_1 /ASSEMBLY_ACC=CAM_ASM_000708 /TAXON_ID=236786 /ORGANISM="Florenciella sp., Strain RCC1007" /LENGTH=77 /DNA_ID=CAMNT_0053300037 /DNA_START=113 /DNA_END=342 /DNA_ORIENTATION=-
MTNVYRGARRVITRQYDLKGSTVGRSARAGEQVRKDNDLVADRFKLHLGHNRPAVLDQLRRDARFMCDNGFVDYSLL